MSKNKEDWQDIFSQNPQPFHNTIQNHFVADLIGECVTVFVIDKDIIDGMIGNVMLAPGREGSDDDDNEAHKIRVICKHDHH